MSHNFIRYAILLLLVLPMVVLLSACSSPDPAIHPDNAAAVNPPSQDETPHAHYSIADEVVTKVIAGPSCSFALTESGRLYAWGSTFLGRLGIGVDKPGEPVTTPTYVPIDGRVIQVAAGDGTVGALTEDGTVYLWGNNRYGVLLDGTTVNRSTPVRVDLGVKVKEIAVGWSHVLALTEAGEVYQWGFTKWTSADVESYTVILPVEPELVNIEGKVKTIAAGAYHSLALTEDGKVYAWGMNSRGQLGYGGHRPQETPGLVPIDDEVIQIDAGTLFSLALTKSGELYSWGGGVLGTGNETTERNTPAPVDIGQKVKQFSAGWSHVLAVTESGDVYSWGWNEYGELGIGTPEHMFTPQKVPLDAPIEYVSAGDAHSFAIAVDGTVYGWGGNRCGQLYDGAQSDRYLPVKCKFK